MFLSCIVLLFFAPTHLEPLPQNMADIEAARSTSIQATRTHTASSTKHQEPPNGFLHSYENDKCHLRIEASSPSSAVRPVSSRDSGEAVLDPFKDRVGVAQGREKTLEEYYVPTDSYEGRHRYDSKAEWSEKEEKALIRRVK